MTFQTLSRLSNCALSCVTDDALRSLLTVSVLGRKFKVDLPSDSEEEADEADGNQEQRDEAEADEGQEEEEEEEEGKAKAVKKVEKGGRKRKQQRGAAEREQEHAEEEQSEAEGAEEDGFQHCSQCDVLAEGKVDCSDHQFYCYDCWSAREGEGEGVGGDGREGGEGSSFSADPAGDELSSLPETSVSGRQATEEGGSGHADLHTGQRDRPLEESERDEQLMRVEGEREREDVPKKRKFDCEAQGLAAEDAHGGAQRRLFQQPSTTSHN
jgi:hypothetical protein